MTSTDKYNSPEAFERIERYLTGKMDAAEKAGFEKEVNQDASLRAAVDEQRTLIRAVETGAMKESLNDIHAETIGVQTKSTSVKNWVAIAAGFAVLVLFGVWILNRQPLSEKLFAEYTTTDPGLPVPMSASDSYNFHDAMVDYKAGKYTKAIGKWKSQLEENPGSAKVSYYIAAAYFNQEKYHEALEYFKQSSAQPGSDFRAKAQWYSVLSNLKLDRKEAVLNTTPLPDSPYREKIESIQQKLQ